MHHQPIALTPIVLKCLEQLVLTHMKNCLPSPLYQFANRSNRITKDAVSIALPSVLTNLDTNMDCCLLTLAWHSIVSLQLMQLNLEILASVPALSQGYRLYDQQTPT